MNLRFFLDPETRLPHIYEHGVSEEEVRQVMEGRGEDRVADQTSRSKLGQTRAGRYLRVVYSRDPEPDSIFVITAYEPDAKARKAFRRRRRRKPQ